MQNLETSVANAYNTLVKFMVGESKNDTQNEAEIKLKSEFLTPRNKFELQGRLIDEAEDIVWVRIIGCACGVLKQDIEYSIKVSKK